MRSQRNYEKGERFPDAAYLAAIAAAGADVRYIITGEREGPPPLVLTADERYLLDRYRSSKQELKDAALRVLLGGAREKYATSQIGQVIKGDQINHEPQTFNFGEMKKDV